MRADVLDFEAFYQSLLGHYVIQSVMAELVKLWPDADGVRLAGFGYCDPYLAHFDKAQLRLSITPAAMGISVESPDWAVTSGQKLMDRTPASAGEMIKKNDICRLISDETSWPLPDASIDRVLLVHGLEETPLATSLLREIWRVLTDNGRIIIIVTNRRSLWAMMERTPLAAGRPYSRGQVRRLLQASFFTPIQAANAVFIPPHDNALARGARPLLDRLGRILWPAFGAVTIIEAEKILALPVKGHQAPLRAARVLRPLASHNLPLSDRLPDIYVDTLMNDEPL